MEVTRNKEVTYMLTVTSQEAQLLRAMLGNTASSAASEAGKSLFSMARALREAGVPKPHGGRGVFKIQPGRDVPMLSENWQAEEE